MSLITCPECGGQLSDLAASCPHCGLPRKDFQYVIDEKSNDLILVCDAKGIKKAIGDFMLKYTELMFGNEYVSCRKLSQVFSKYERVYQAIQRVKRVDELAVQLQMHKDQVQYFMDHMATLSEEVDQHNDWYLAQSLRTTEGYLDQILYDVDQIPLDRKSVV